AIEGIRLQNQHRSEGVHCKKQSSICTEIASGSKRRAQHRNSGDSAHGPEVGRVVCEIAMVRISCHHTSSSTVNSDDRHGI
ncbi:hypothetical protein J6590_051854, partial [Homalodisca vitripennis]